MARSKPHAVMVVTNHQDPAHATYVGAALTEMGHPWVRFNCDDFPAGAARAAGTSSLETDVASGRWWVHLDLAPNRSFVRAGDRRVSLDDIGTIWFRRPAPPVVPAALSGADLAYAVSASTDTIDSLYLELKDRFWVNDPWASRRFAENKWYQMRQAQAAGFRVPETIVTTDADEARAFFKRHGGRVVFKPHQPYVRAEKPDEFRVVFTSAVKAKHLRNDDLFASSPVRLQERIDKAYELRVTVMGRHVFAVHIDSQALPESRLDWRRGQHTGRLRQTPTTLAPKVANAVRRLMSSLGLVFGALDLIVTPDGETVFLEVNPQGQWLWQEFELGLPMLQTFVAFLLGGQRDPAITRRVPQFDLHAIARANPLPADDVRLPPALDALRSRLGRWQYPTPEAFAAALVKSVKPGASPPAGDTHRAVVELLVALSDRAPHPPSSELVRACAVAVEARLGKGRSLRRSR